MLRAGHSSPCTQYGQAESFIPAAQKRLAGDWRSLQEIAACLPSRISNRGKPFGTGRSSSASASSVSPPGRFGSLAWDGDAPGWKKIGRRLLRFGLGYFSNLLGHVSRSHSESRVHCPLCVCERERETPVHSLLQNPSCRMHTSDTTQHPIMSGQPGITADGPLPLPQPTAGCRSGGMCTPSTPSTAWLPRWKESSDAGQMRYNYEWLKPLSR